MSSSAKEQVLGPIEDQAWATRLQSHVTTPGPSPRIHGYDVESDLAPHYGFADLLLLAVLGDLPSDEARRALEIAMSFVAPISTASAPAHAAMLVRLCGSTSSAAFAAGAFTLAEEARFVVEAHRGFLAHLQGDGANLPAEALDPSGAERSSLDRLRAEIARAGIDLPILAAPLTRLAAILAVFHACGARRPEQVELLLLLARLPCVGAEALATMPTQFKTYPITLPPFRFEAPDARD
ncbi:MAG TPA: hypothetical protein VF407_02280 [Polyangiaceae bacterium]